MTNAELIKALRNCGNGIDCKGCPYLVRFADGEHCFRGKIANDAADAIEAADKRIADLETALAACRARKGEQLPKEGEWIEDEYGYIHCSKCGMEWDEPEHPNTNYCPNCGAKMRTVTDCHTLEESERC